jgi:hypothetical protein
MVERMIWWMDMCSAMILFATGLFVAVEFADLLSPVFTGFVLLGTIICFLLQFESLGQRHELLYPVRRPQSETNFALDFE